MLEDFKFDFEQCKQEVKEFGELLQSKEELSERSDILPFFKKHLHVSAFVANNVPTMTNYDRIKHEYQLFGDFQADLVVGDSKRHSYCFIEFEDGKQDSIFKSKKKRKSPEWSSKFEHGYSQIIDWFWKLDDMKKTDAARRDFGNSTFSAHGMLVIGRSSNLSRPNKERLQWRSNKVIIDSHSIVCLTFDMLYEDMQDKIALRGTI
jgi:Domain of unknown function (DUF4263)